MKSPLRQIGLALGFGGFIIGFVVGFSSCIRAPALAASDKEPQRTAVKKKAAQATSFRSDEIKLWRANAQLQQIAKKINPLGRPAGDGALGLNRRFPDRVLVNHQLEGWNWIRAGVALGNGFIIDRGIMAFEWAFARMGDDGSFGDSKTVEISHFLGLYARSVIMLKSAKFDDRAERLARLSPRLETSLRSSRSLLGERRWNGEEMKSWVTHQRVQAAAAAYWIGQLLVNPGLSKTSDIWLNEALKRQEGTGFFPSGFPPNSKAAFQAQLDILESLQGLALRDSLLALKLRGPIANGYKWAEKSPHFNVGKKALASVSTLVTVASYGAWTGNKIATGFVANQMRAIK